ncbi:MAG: endonuclease [Dehalococcoidia bacterium]
MYHALDAMHGNRHWHWWPDGDPFEVIVGAILVQNTAWTNVEHALARLRAASALNPRTMAALPVGQLEALIRPSGQYRQKARKLRAFLDLVAEHGTLGALLALPSDTLRERLLATWGIGEETADVIVLYAARRPSFVIDAYTRRLFARLALGPGPGEPYEAWKRHFERHLPRDRDLWARYHALIVLHNKHLCRKRAPRCGECALSQWCPAAVPRPV